MFWKFPPRAQPYAVSSPFLPGASVCKGVPAFLPGASVCKGGSVALGMSRCQLVALSSSDVPLTTFCEAVAAEEDNLGAESPQCPVPPLPSGKGERPARRG